MHHLYKKVPGQLKTIFKIFNAHLSWEIESIFCVNVRLCPHAVYTINLTLIMPTSGYKEDKEDLLFVEFTSIII